MYTLPLQMPGFLTHDVAEDLLLECQLFLLTFAVGINDAATFTDFHTFVSNQTGNTVFLTIGALGLAKDLVNLRHVGLSLGGFLSAGLIAGRLANRFGRRKRWWLILTNLFQTLTMYAAAGLRKWYVKQDGDPRVYAVIFLLSFGAGFQLSMARAIKIAEMPTGMLTSAYTDGLNDPLLFTIHNRKRNRRIGTVVGLLVGGFVGSVALRHEGAALSFLLAAIVKTLVTITFFFNRSGAKPKQAAQADNKTPKQEV